MISSFGIGSSQTTDLFTVKETLITTSAVSSLTGTSTVKTTTEEKLSATDQVKIYINKYVYISVFARLLNWLHVMNSDNNIVGMPKSNVSNTFQLSA